MFLALLSAGYMLSLLTANPCVSELENVPGKNETIAYKCFAPDHKLPKDELTKADAWQKNPYKKKDNRK